MTRSQKTNRSTRRLTAGVIGAAVSVIALSIVVTLGVEGYVDLSFVGIGAGNGATKYRNVTLTDAQLECEKEARKQFGERLRLITVDSHSSRFDQKADRYKMFFNLDVYPKQGKDGITVPYFLNCYVHGSRGSVTHFESLEDKEATTQPQRKPEGNIFGF